jgi:hypothetical protein
MKVVVVSRNVEIHLLVSHTLIYYIDLTPKTETV